MLLTIPLTSYEQTNKESNILISFVDTTKDLYGYKNLKGDTIIPLGKYSICYTDPFRTYAIVLIPHKGFVGIDRQENILYEVFTFDNGPDETSDGLFRIITNNKIGYVNSSSGKIAISPKYACAWPFENGIAKVSFDSQIRTDGEHKIWLSHSWYYINKTGKKVNLSKAK